jgi:hypothetical protein
VVSRNETSAAGFVSAEEASKGAALIAEYRENEQLAIANDVSAARARIRHPECDVFEAEALREKIRGMSREKLLGAQSRLNELRKDAHALCIPILERLRDEFDRQLHEITIQREVELQQIGIPLFSDAIESGHPVRRFELHNDPIVNNLHVRREMCRHKALDLEAGDAIGCVQWLCTDEPVVPFQWL